MTSPRPEEEEILCAEFPPSLGCGGGYGLQGTYEIGREQQGGGGRREEEGERRVMVPERAKVFLPFLLFLLPSFSQDKCAKKPPSNTFCCRQVVQLNLQDRDSASFLVKGAVDRICGLSTVTQYKNANAQNFVLPPKRQGGGGGG